MTTLRLSACCLLLVSSRPGAAAAEDARSCTVASFGAVADNATDNTKAFRSATASGCQEVVVEPGIWLTGPFNLSSNTILNVMRGATISGSRDPETFPIVTQLPLDEAYRAPHMNNSQYQALISAYGASNISLIGGGIVDGQGWDWWFNFSMNASNTWAHQRPKLVEFVDSTDILVSNLTLMNSPFWTFHPIFCTGVRVSYLQVLAPRDHGNTDGIDPSSCNDVHVTDCIIDVGDDAVSVKAGRHWKSKERVAAQNYLFERVTILHRNFAIGSDVSGGVRNITFRDGIIGDDLGSSPWAIKLKTDSQEGGLIDGVYFRNLHIGNITYCGSSRFVYTKPHATEDNCEPREVGATMLNLGMGYGGLAPTDPGLLRNILFDGIAGIGSTGSLMSAHGLNASLPIMNVTIKNVSLDAGGPWLCSNVQGVQVQDVRRWPSESTCGGLAEFSV